MRYLDDGRLSIGNNLPERPLRGIAVNRKNLLFMGSDAGCDRAAVIYTIAETVRLNGLGPDGYIAAILGRRAAGYPVISIADLLPWKFRPDPKPVVMG